MWWVKLLQIHMIPESKVHGANMGPTWGRKDPGGSHVGLMNLAIWDHKGAFLRIGNSKAAGWPVLLVAVIQWCLNKLGNILQTRLSSTFSWKKNFQICIRISR